MRSEEINPNDPMFLVSRNLDGELTGAEQSRLAKLLSESPEMRREAEKYCELNEALKSFGCSMPDVDFGDFSDRVRQSLGSSEDDAQLVEVDQAIQSWASKPVVFDEERFTAGVLEQIGESRSSTSRSRSILFRIGMPFAAAAAVALVWIGGFRNEHQPRRVADVQIGGIERVATHISHGNTRLASVVSFDRTPVETDRSTRSGGISLSFVGSLRAELTSSEVAPPL